jgi:hypothetical protein
VPAAGTNGVLPGFDAAGAPGLLPATDLGALPAGAPGVVNLLPPADQVQFAAGFPLGDGIDELYLALLALAVAGALGTAGVIWLGARSS